MSVNLSDSTPAHLRQLSFSELKKAVGAKGLLETQPLYYAWRVPVTLAMLIPGVVVLMLFDSPWIQLLNALYCAVVFTQIVFIGHDCGHRQVFRDGTRNDILALCCIPTVGIGYSWWCDTHNKHHGDPNHDGGDPAVTYDGFAFSRTQALRTTGPMRFLLRFQAFYLVPGALFYPILMRIHGISFIIRERPRFAVIEALLFVLHFPIYFWLVFNHLSLGTGLMFVAVHQGLFSLFLVSTFAPNHKGMPLVEDGHEMDFLHQQVLTSQNVQSSRLADFWFGGLNHQIEHHLFPRMPRNRLREAREIVKPFCEEHAISYREATAPRCYWDILKFMHHVARPLGDDTERYPDSEMPLAAPGAGGND